MAQGYKVIAVHCNLFQPDFCANGCSGMALPRWVMAPHVDSYAMLSAAAWFRETHTEKWNEMELEGQLTKVTHLDLPPWFPVTRLDTTDDWTKLVTCPHAEDGRCKRCAVGRSGYTFRWLSPYWVDEYDRRRGLYSWSPGDDEYSKNVHLGPTFTGKPMDAIGQILDTQ